MRYSFIEAELPQPTIILLKLMEATFQQLSGRKLSALRKDSFSLEEVITEAW